MMSPYSSIDFHPFLNRFYPCVFFLGSHSIDFNSLQTSSRHSGPDLDARHPLGPWIPPRNFWGWSKGAIPGYHAMPRPTDEFWHHLYRVCEILRDFVSWMNYIAHGSTEFLLFLLNIICCFHSFHGYTPNPGPRALPESNRASWEIPDKNGGFRFKEKPHLMVLI